MHTSGWGRTNSLGAMRRWLTPALLAFLTAGFAFLAARTPVTAEPAVAATPGTAPVLSARRVPDLVSSFVADSRLADRLTALLGDSSLGEGRRNSCLVVRQGPRLVFEREPAKSLIPASNLKIVTASVALTRLGAVTRMETPVVARTRPADGVVDGPLWLIGSGDPLLATDDYADFVPNKPAHTRFEDLAQALVDAGVREVRGGIVGDESRYDTQRYIPTWKRGYITDGDVGPQSALVVNDGYTAWNPRKVVTDQPAVHAARILTDLLRARGVTVAGEPTAGQPPSGLVKVAHVSSLPVAEIVGEMLRESDNNTAELLVKELGKRFGGAGTTAAGLEVIRSTLADSGLAVDGLTTIDGSGLDRADRASCRLLMDALAGAGPDGDLARGLPVAGRTGTLATRFRGSPVVDRLQAKTGSLDGVTALSGYLDGTRGGDLVFAFIANGLPVPTERLGQGLQERLGAVLATYPEAPLSEEIAAK